MSSSLFSSFLNNFKEWSRNNPKKAFLLFLIFGYQFIKFVRNTLKRPKNLKNKVVFITGGASGIGRKVALLLKKLGAIVIVCDINQKSIKEMESLVDMALVLDVTDEKKVKEVAKKIESQYNSLDVLINNAGIVVAKGILELPPKLIRKVFDVNIIAHYWTIQAFLPKMLEKNDGHIVTIASASGISGAPYLADYSATKFACRGLDQALKRELSVQGYKGIKFTCVNPYFIDTGMFDGVVDSQWFFLRWLMTLLDPDYVAGEIVKSIQYEWREIRLPYRMGFTSYFEHVLPFSVQDWMMENVCDVTKFKGH